MKSIQGNVYLFRQIGTNYVKIGMTQDESVAHRFKSFKMYSPTGAEIVGVILTDDPISLERKIHKEFAIKRLEGEFFDLTQAECINLIKKYETGREYELRSIFEAWISNPVNNAEKLTSILKISLEKDQSYINDPLYVKVWNLCGDNFSNKEVSSTEIKDMLDENSIHITKNKLGIILLKKYKQVLKKVSGKPKRIYFIP